MAMTVEKFAVYTPDGEFNRDEFKRLRTQGLGYTQEQMASEIGVTLATINRWERGAAIPRGLTETGVRRVERRVNAAASKG